MNQEKSGGIKAASACLFSSYFMRPSLPFFVRAYLDDLISHFESVVFITNNEKTLDAESCAWLTIRNIQLVLVKNEGYDFGMWHKALMQMDTESLEELALVNDSCIRFAPLQSLISWCRTSGYDYVGLTDSNQNQRHIQSYFLLIKKQAIVETISYFRLQGIASDGFESVIDRYEIGLSQQMLKCGFSIGAYFSVEYSNFNYNLPYLFSIPLIKAGMPLVKRKLLSLKLNVSEFDYFNYQGKKFTPGMIIQAASDLHGLNAKEVDLLFSDTLKAAELNQRGQLLIRKFRRTWLYPLLGIKRSNDLLEKSDFADHHGYQILGPDRVPIET